MPGSSPQQVIVQEALEYSMKALGLASMSTFTKSANLSVEARKRYTTAVSKTNAALKEPGLAKDDRLLSTVLILNAFETISGADAQSLTNCSTHAFGATELVRLRGPQQFKSPVGLVLFISAISLVMAAAVRDNRPLPEDILPLAEQARPGNILYKDYWDFFLVKIEFTEYFSRHMVSWPIPDNLLDLEAAARKALAFDARIVEIFDRLDDFHRYTTVFLPELEGYCVDGHCDVYKHFLVAQMWNDMRIHRIVLHSIIRRSLAHIKQTSRWTVDERHAQIRKSKRTMVELQEGILRSVPQHLGKISFEKGSPKPFPTPTTAEPIFNFPWTAFKAFLRDPAAGQIPVYHGSPVPRAHGGCTLSWGLFTAAKVEGVDKNTLHKLIKMMQLLGLPQGNSQSAVLADLAKVERRFF